MDSSMYSIRSYYQLSLAKLCFPFNMCVLTMAGIVEHMKSVSRRTHAYLLSFLVVRVVVSIWRFAHEAATEVLLIVLPITHVVVYFAVIKTKELFDKLWTEISGFRAGLQLETGSIWCSNILYGKRNAPRNYQEDLDYRYCLQELDGIRARPDLQEFKAKLMSYLAVALLLVLVVFCSYVAGRLHAWYKHSRATVATRDFGTGKEHSSKTDVLRARPVYIRRVRHFLRSAHLKRSSISSTTERELEWEQRNIPSNTATPEATTAQRDIHDTTPAGVATSTQPNQAAVTNSFVDVVLEQQVTALKARLDNLNRENNQLKRQGVALAHEKEQLQTSLRAAQSKSDEVASLKRKITEQEAAQELQRSVMTRQRKRFDEKYGATTLTQERLAGAEAREARLNERVRRLGEDLETKRLEAKLEAEMLRKDLAAEKEGTALAEEQLKGLQSQIANLPAMPTANMRCDHEEHLRTIENDARNAIDSIAAAAAEQKEQEITQLRQAAEAEIRSLQNLLQTCSQKYEEECYRVTLLQSNLGVADYAKAMLDGEMGDLREAGERSQAENAELRSQVATMAQELASQKAQCKRLEELQRLGANTAGSIASSMYFGRADDAAVPFENLPTWQPRSTVRPEHTEAARIAARAKAPLPPRGSAEEQAAKASSAPVLQEVVWQQKQMSALDESHFADRITKFVEVAAKSYQKWNSSTLSQADGAEKVAANFLDIILNWEYVQPYMLERSKLKQIALNIISTEGKWPERLLQEQAPGFKARAKMVKYARDILARIAAMTETGELERTGNKRSRS